MKKLLFLIHIIGDYILIITITININLLKEDEKLNLIMQEEN